MKILQVNCVHKKGSTGKIAYDVHCELLKRGQESVICYGRGERVQEPLVYKTCPEWYSKANHLLSWITGLMYGGLFFSTNKLIRVIRKEKPDIVHLHCLNGYFVNIYRLIAWLKKHHIKTLLTLHAEFMHTANCGHALDCDKWLTGCGHCPRLKAETKSLFFDRTHDSWKKMKSAFDGFSELRITSVSPWLMSRAKQSPILSPFPHEVVLNGLDTSIFCRHDTAGLREKHNLSDQKIVFHATASFSDVANSFKGGDHIIALAKKFLGQNVVFIVAGPHPDDIQVPENMILLGTITDQKLLAQYYNLADVTVIASKKETFSMICAESLCCGTPVIGFRAGGPEQISLKEYSTFVEYGDLNALYSICQQYLYDEKQCDTAIYTKAASTYALTGMTNNYIEEYRKLLFD